MLSSEHGPELVNFPEVGEDFDCVFYPRPSKAAQRREGRLAIQIELDELGDLYELPEGLQIPGVRN